MTLLQEPLPEWQQRGAEEVKTGSLALGQRLQFAVYQPSVPIMLVLCWLANSVQIYHGGFAPSYHILPTVTCETDFQKSCDTCTVGCSDFES